MANPSTAKIIGVSAFALITSALPLKADVAAVGRESPKLTHNGHSRLSLNELVSDFSMAPFRLGTVPHGDIIVRA